MNNQIGIIIYLYSAHILCFYTCELHGNVGRDISSSEGIPAPLVVGQGDNNGVVGLLKLKRHREKRFLFLLQPNGGLYKLVLSLAMPLELRFKRSLVLAVNFQWQYLGLTTVAQIKKPYPPIVAKSQSKRSISDRQLLYLGIEATLNKQGFSGRSCLLRMICENSFNPYSIEENAVLGQLLHIILTPSFSNDQSTDLNQEYFEAETAGTFGVDCQSLYPHCKNLVDNFSFNMLFSNMYKAFQ